MQWLGSAVGLPVHAGCWTLQYEEERMQAVQVPSRCCSHTCCTGEAFTQPGLASLFLDVHASFGATYALPCPVPGVSPECALPLQALLTRRKSSKKFCMYDLTVTVVWKGHWVDDESKKVKAGAGFWWGAWLWDWLWKWLWPVGLPAAQPANRVRKGQWVQSSGSASCTCLGVVLS